MYRNFLTHRHLYSTAKLLTFYCTSTADRGRIAFGLTEDEKIKEFMTGTVYG